jgi:NAD(P)-dependent dehydrogenase (short-subunit alcohol dehydrogenase family)
MQNPFDLTARVALVTGAGRGIGREIARVFAGAGADLAIADIDSDSAADAAAEIASMGRRALGIRADVADRVNVDEVVDAVIAEFGQIDILVNNAALAPTNKPVLEDRPEDWIRALDVDVNGAYWCSRAVGRQMVSRGSGAIVNIASMSGIIVNRPQPQAAYNASKAAVIHLTRSLAAEWAANGVRVNAVSPGYIGTDMTKRGFATPGWGETWLSMTPMGRMGTPTEVAWAAWFLASDAASYCTGTNLVCDGGYTIW